MPYATAKAAYRAKLRARGASEKRARLPSKFDTARFVAVDGEGFSDGPETRVSIGHPPREYVARDHYYALLTDSDGEEIHEPNGRLSTQACLDFLLAIRVRDARALPVIFGGSYDICHMLAHGLSAGEIELLFRDGGDARSGQSVDTQFGEFSYRISYRPRKELTIRRWPAGADKYEHYRKRDGSRVWRLTKHDKVTLWDVWGFFQGTFVEAMDKWLPDDPDWQFIKREKGKRSMFDRSEIDTIRRYNAAEVRCLAAMMNNVRDSICSLGLSVTRWDGAGAIAGAMFRVHGVKDHTSWAPDDVFDAACVAYAGGHIEACAVGFHDGTIYHNDINSAYPSWFRSLPSLAVGRWRGGQGAPPPGFTMVLIAFRFMPGLPFYPLFYRQDNGSILYPERGRGWYWFPEYDAARQFAEQFDAFVFRVEAWWSFDGRSNERPFGWIDAYYAARQNFIEESKRTGKPNGEEKMIKLGLNSCYGKTAQQVGARVEDGEIVPPSYFQIEWSGYVTAGCRAQIMLAAMQKPDAVISFATDAIFSTEPLDLYCPAEKQLGAWEAATHKAMTIVMPGVYWLHDADKVEHHSRGYDKSLMEDYQIVHDAWRRGQRSIAMDHTRMITLGQANMSDGFWRLRGLFTTSTRSLALDGENSKRLGVAMSRARCQSRLERTHPRDLTEDYSLLLSSLMSAPYPISFLETDTEQDAASLDPFFSSGRDGAEALAHL